MAPLPEKLRLGIQTLKQGQYSQAIHFFEAFLQETKPGGKPYLQAQMHLVEAYQGNGQDKLALSLCSLLATSDSPQVQKWAQQVIKELSPVKVEQQAAVQSASMAEEIAVSSVQSETPSSPTPATQPDDAPSIPSGQEDPDVAFLQAKTQLLEKLLKRGQRDRAISLCLTMATSNNPKVKKWAQQVFRELSAANSSPVNLPSVRKPKAIKPPVSESPVIEAPSRAPISPPPSLPKASSSSLPSPPKSSSTQLAELQGLATDYLKVAAMEQLMLQMTTKKTVLL